MGSGISFKGGGGGSKTTSKGILYKMNFQLQKSQDSRKTLVERHIRLLRMKYLRKITGFRKAGRPIVYTDKTYIHSCSLLFAVDQK